MIMKSMRTQTKPVLWIIIVAFVGTIIFAWGMDFTMRPGERGVIGKVDGYEIKADEFSFVFQNALAQRQSQEADITDEQSRQIQDEVFQQIVQTRLIQNVIEDRGFEVTGKELAEFLRRFPPSEVQQAEIFQTEGRFDYNKYMQAYQNPDPQLWLQVEALVRPRLLQQKVIEYVTAAALVDDTDVRELYNAATEKVAVRYVNAASGDFRDSVAAPTDAEVGQYYDAHPDEFRHDQRARLQYVEFSKMPSDDDTALVLHEAEELARRAGSGEHFGDLAATYSDEQTANGALGWFRRGAMVKPFEDAAFALDSGQVSQPVLSQFGFHVIKCEGRRGEGDDAEVNASHILLRVEVSPGTLSDQRLRAQQFADDARRIGMDSAAVQNGFIVRQSSFFGPKDRIVGIGNEPGINAYAFESELGAVSDVMETATAYVVVRTSVREPAGITPLEEVRARIVATLRGTAQQERAMAALQPVRRAIVDGMTMHQAAAQFGVRVDSTTPFGRLDAISAIGSDPVFSGVAFSLKSPADLSPIIKFRRGAAILQLIDRQLPDPQLYVEKRDSLMDATLSGRQQIVFNGWLTKLRDNSDVKDFRYQVPDLY